MIGDYLKSVDDMPTEAAFRFEGKTRKQKIDQNDIIRELFNCGMGGSFYGMVIHVPEEWPDENLLSVDLYEPENAAKIFAQLCGYTLLDRNGRLVTGRLPEQEERK